MRIIYLFLFLSIAIILPAQRKKKNTEVPTATSSEERWKGYQQRLQLEESSLVKNIPFKNVGPTVMSGRVVDLEVDPADPSHFYVAYASGSLWETKNNGTSFEPRFDNQIVMTIGDIAVDWTNNILYVGSGENNSSRSSYSGFGMFKSTDNGDSWENIGLTETHHIGRILIHPTNPNTLWVGALGHLYSENSERGVFKSTDGGATWNKTLFINNRTGIIDMIMHPENSNVIIAAAWEKDRKAWNFEEAGAGTAIYRSEDGGNTWNEIADSSGFPDTNGTGRIGLAFAPSDANIVYAILDNQDRREKDDDDEDQELTKDQLRTMSNQQFLALENSAINSFLDNNGFPQNYNAVDIKMDVEEGKVKPIDLVIYTEDANSLLFDTPVKGGEMYRSNDAGKTWAKTHEDYIESMIFSYGYYFGQVRVDGQDPNVIYTMGVPIVRSDDGGKTFKSINEDNVHVDHHALWINPNDPRHLILGNDGGVYVSFDTGATWINCNSPSVGQFYSIAVDMEEPYNVYGGLQDNGVWKGPSNYTYSRGWYQEGRYPYERLMGGDGMQVAVDTRDNATVYTGYQFGNYFRLNTQTGERKYITPRHTLGDSPYRWNWEAPITLSSHNQDIVYFGSNRFHRSMDMGENFETLSEDLTLGGKKGDVSYGTLTTISESPTRFGLIYVGSDDGLIHRSDDVGDSWTNITNELPSNFWVSTVVASQHSEGRVYASLNGYRWDNFEPLVYRSDNYGKNWKDISGNLPDEPINVVKEDPVNENIIYIGTDHGVYVSMDGGSSYHAFAQGLPNTPVHDLIVHPREKDLVLGTHGRGIYIGNVALIQQMNDEILAKTIHAFPMEEITASTRWGSKTWTWGDVIEPTTSVNFYSNSKANGKIEIIYKDEVVSSKDISADNGLNIVEISLETDSSFKELLNDEQKEKYKEAENGDFHLVAGEYTVRITLGDTNVETPLTIKKPRERPGRKE
ncbi:WD40/YVTN/BNR-like repeat-containing protein [Ekhidna sp. To15]|uniref:WD40/YVTN/BNR-like repeat-containing protein n=1 Tax=Ekhidna sp. To15 TaxID=3395267 RepID=UPI003F51E7E5